MPGSIGINSIQTSKKNLIRISGKKTPQETSKLRVSGKKSPGETSKQATDSRINSQKGSFVIKSQEMDDLKKTLEQTNERITKQVMEKGVELRHFDFENVKVGVMQKGELVELAKSLKYQLETMKAREEDIKSKLGNYVKEGDNITETIELLKEREYSKKLYQKEQERNHQYKIVMDSQNRILSSKHN